ncbi:TPA: hypothetical protein EYP84_00765 [Candidatus Bipolaricaulota bacterium]|nr:hypothetical protein [Candidatus Bipolaricaulota bacterium]
MTLFELIAQLPSRYTHADRKKDFPIERSRAIIETLSPSEHAGVKQVEFTDGQAVVTFTSGETREFGPGSEFLKIRDALSAFFTADDGFTAITGINYIDGVRIYFSNGDISHLRPSGNAPEFRNYAIANTPERARKIVEIGLRKIIPAMAEKFA